MSIKIEAKPKGPYLVSGTVELRVQGQHYEVSFELATTAPDLAEPVPVRVRGSGRGFIVGSVFTGTTEEWMTLEAPPEELGDLGEVELPARAGLKIVSTSQASFDEHGVFQILLQNYPAPGQKYLPSMTVLAGNRLAAAPAETRTEGAR